jgi:hypothetical protein
MYTNDDVAKLVVEIEKRKSEPDDVVTVDLSAVEIGAPSAFGLAVDLYDPVSGQIMTICRPHRTDVAQSEIFLTADQAAVEIMQARMRRVRHDHAHGLVPPVVAKPAPAPVPAAPLKPTPVPT